MAKRQLSDLQVDGRILDSTGAPWTPGKMLTVDANGKSAWVEDVLVHTPASSGSAPAPAPFMYETYWLMVPNMVQWGTVDPWVLEPTWPDPNPPIVAWFPSHAWVQANHPGWLTNQDIFGVGNGESINDRVMSEWGSWASFEADMVAAGVPVSSDPNLLSAGQDAILKGLWLNFGAGSWFWSDDPAATLEPRARLVGTAQGPTPETWTLGRATDPAAPKVLEFRAPATLVMAETETAFSLQLGFAQPIVLDQANRIIRIAGAAQGRLAVSVGHEAVAHSHSTSVGALAHADSDSSVAVGSSANATGDHSVAIGAAAGTTRDRSVAIGRLAATSDEDSIAIGANAAAQYPFEIQLGAVLDSGGNDAHFSLSVGAATPPWGFTAFLASSEMDQRLRYYKVTHREEDRLTANQPYVVTHYLNDDFPLVQVWDVAARQLTSATVRSVDDQSVSVTVATTKDYRIVVSRCDTSQV